MKDKINPIQKAFGGLNITWPRLIVFSNFKLTGYFGKRYPFILSDDENEYEMEFYYDEETQSVVVKLINEDTSYHIDVFKVRV